MATKSGVVTEVDPAVAAMLFPYGTVLELC